MPSLGLFYSHFTCCSSEIRNLLERTPLLLHLLYQGTPDTALKNVEKLYPGSSSWDDLGIEPSFGGATRDSEDNILVDMGIDTSVDSDSSSDSLDRSDPAPSSSVVSTAGSRLPR